MVKESTVQEVILVLEEVLRYKNMRPLALDAGTILDGSIGLESLDFAEIVVPLADEFENDPFASEVTPEVTTLGDLAALY